MKLTTILLRVRNLKSEVWNSGPEDENSYLPDFRIVPGLARFHIEFEEINPFIGGNGRTGRLLVNLELMKAGYPPIDIKFADRIAYYNAFD